MDTVGRYLAARLAQLGLKHHFVVPGDYNLVLLDQFLLEQGMRQINCTNELNCSFAAEGYARVNGAAACVVTFSVGALSAFDGIAGAYAENLPVILISGAPNTNDAAEGRNLHHTLGVGDGSYQLEMARRITCAAVAIRKAEDAPRLIDRAIRAAWLAKKPAYIEIPVNLADAPCTPPGPISAVIGPEPSDPASLAAAVESAAAFLAKARKPMLLAGPKLRAAGAEAAFRELAAALGCAVAVTPDAKGLFPEPHPQFVGVAWGEVATRGANAIVDWSDGVVCAGAVFNDYTTVGWTAQPSGDQVLTADFDYVSLPGGEFSRVRLADFLSELARKVGRNDATMAEYARIRPASRSVPTHDPAARLSREEVMRQVQALLTPQTTLLVETGDSWFNGVRMDLPDGARFEIEMQWGHIGWSVPASFGYALGAPDRNIVVLVGDGSFQVTAQEVAQLIRHRLPVLLILLNNHGYAIEAQIHDGPYNTIKNWDYAALVEAFNAGDGHGRGFRVASGGELAAALGQAAANRTGPTLIECVIDRDDCTEELIVWGRRVAAANARPPQKT